MYYIHPLNTSSELCLCCSNLGFIIVPYSNQAGIRARSCFSSTQPLQQRLKRLTTSPQLAVTVIRCAMQWKKIGLWASLPGPMAASVSNIKLNNIKRLSAGWFVYFTDQQAHHDVSVNQTYAIPCVYYEQCL